MAKCSLCPKDGVYVVGHFAVCDACAKRLTYIIRALANPVANGAVSILWDGGRIARKEWLELKKFIHEYGVKSVLEYGVGLTTEMLSLESCIEHIYCIEANKYWFDTMLQAAPVLKVSVNFFPRYLDIPDEMNGMLPQYDLALVDGPDSGRGYSVEHALKHAKYMYMHDPATKDQQTVIMAAKDAGAWEPFLEWGKKSGCPRFWKKIQSVEAKG